MIDQGSSRPTARSGFPSNPSPLLLDAKSSICNNSHNEVFASPLNSEEQGPSLSFAPAPNTQCLPDSTHNATRSCAPSSQAVPPLHLQTDLPNAAPVDAVELTPKESSAGPYPHQSLSAASLPKRTPSMRANFAPSSAGSFSPASLISSPQLAAMGDITPLPSPIFGYASSWRGDRRDSLSRSRTSSISSSQGLRHVESLQMPAPSMSRSRSKQYPGLDKLSNDSPLTSRTSSLNNTNNLNLNYNNDNIPCPAKRVRNMSVSDYAPTGNANPAPPQTGPTPSSSDDLKSNNVLHREHYLAVDRGIALPPARPPTPPRSSHGSSSGDMDEEPAVANISYQDIPQEIYFVRSVRTQQLRKYRMLRQLGKGTFSQVCLAVRLESDNTDAIGYASGLNGINPTVQKLVAVKVVEYGPAGGADEDRVEVSLKREVDILKSVNHPSLVQLKAFGSDEKRALLVLDYCPGGDLFDFVASHLNVMSPSLIRRVFAELVDAVRHLHRNYIVHRDIKLENVLINVPASTMESITDWQTYDRAVVTLTDLGLSRRIPEPPECPLLRTRCGSEDYAAPEILMGQPYDGRSTDAWALGVLLYAIMENRLPFDAVPGTRGDPAMLRARTPHRIARCEWSWYRFADDDEEWDPVKGKDLEGARECVEGLLKKNTKRRSLDEISTLPWVQDAIIVPGGLKRGDKEVP